MAVVLGTEDWMGPYELLWTVEEYYPEAPATDQLEASIDALSRLARFGLVELCRVVEKRGPMPDEPTLSRNEIDSAVADPLVWDGNLPLGNSVWFATTELGRRALKEGKFRDEGF